MKRLFFAVCMAGLLMAGFAAQQRDASAVTTEGQLKPVDSTLFQTVTMDCLAVKFQLNEVHRNDKLLRVTLGEAYDNMSSELMGNLNTRILANRLDGTEMIKIAADFERGHKDFRESYSDYDDMLVRLIKADCQTSPQGYYASLETTRELRETLHEEVDELNTLIQRYHDAFEEFRDKLETQEERDDTDA